MPTTSAGVYFEDRGSGSDVLLWIHGFGSSTRGAKGVVEAFDDHRSVLIDLPGFGRSAGVGEGARFPAMAEAALGVMDELGIDEYVVIGTSMGGGVALRMALDRPHAIRMVIGVVPFPAQGLAKDASDATASVMVPLHGNPEALRFAYTAMSKHSPDDALNAAMDELVEDSCMSSPGAWADMLSGGGAQFSQFDELGSLSVPFCSILGADDVVLPVTDQLATAAAVPRGRAVVLSGLGHMMQGEDPQRVIDEIRASLNLSTTANA
jgi:pimeloyl-ACP methyl ester carboxylesterase